MKNSKMIIIIIELQNMGSTRWIINSLDSRQVARMQLNRRWIEQFLPRAKGWRAWRSQSSGCMTLMISFLMKQWTTWILMIGIPLQSKSHQLEQGLLNQEPQVIIIQIKKLPEVLWIFQSQTSLMAKGTSQRDCRSVCSSRRITLWRWASLSRRRKPRLLDCIQGSSPQWRYST